MGAVIRKPGGYKRLSSLEEGEKVARPREGRGDEGTKNSINLRKQETLLKKSFTEETESQRV